MEVSIMNIKKRLKAKSVSESFSMAESLDTLFTEYDWSGS